MKSINSLSPAIRPFIRRASVKLYLKNKNTNKKLNEAGTHKNYVSNLTIISLSPIQPVIEFNHTNS